MVNRGAPARRHRRRADHLRRAGRGARLRPPGRAHEAHRARAARLRRRCGLLLGPGRARSGQDLHASRRARCSWRTGALSAPRSRPSPGISSVELLRGGDTALPCRSALDTDVAIIGAGVVGARSRASSPRFELRVTLLEAGADVGAGTSKANTAILHTGFDAKPGTLEARLVRARLRAARASTRSAWASRSSGPARCSWPGTTSSVGELAGIVEQRRARTATTRSARARRATSSTGASRTSAPARRGALEVPGEAHRLPVHDRRSPSPPRRCWPAASSAAPTPVTLRRRGSTAAGFRLATPARRARPRASSSTPPGCARDEVDRMLGHDGFTVTPRRGELIVFDKLARPLVDHDRAAGADEGHQGRAGRADGLRQRHARPDRRGRASERTTPTRPRAGLDYLLAEGARIMPALLAPGGHGGLRRACAPPPSTPTTSSPSTRRRGLRLRRAASARPGCPASMAIAEHVREELGAAGLRLEPTTGPAAGAPDAEHRRGVARPYQRRRADRRGPRLRPHRLLLRARDPRRDPRRARRRRSRRATSTACAAAPARTWAAARASICGAELGAPLLEPGATRMTASVVVGGGPAGLAAALELRRRGTRDVLVLEREAAAGGIPRHARHQGFGLRDLRRPLSGPAYARRYARLARRRRRRAPHGDDGHRLVAGRDARADRAARPRDARSRRGRSSPPAAASGRAPRGSCRAPGPRAS